MSLYLVMPGVEMSLEVFVPLQVEEAFAIQWERLKTSKEREKFANRVAQQLQLVLPQCVDWDIREPTQAQLTYAQLIAQQLGIPLPSEARKFRYHTAMFLETYSEQVKPKRSQDPSAEKVATGGQRSALEFVLRTRRQNDPSQDAPPTLTEQPKPTE
ncbi:hypothetical protein [Solilutibacter silvestris]|uniref:hypothetical protein n=1 Tax=Solilutibacter silvestris TaxID=1645665 RepID=UPI0013FD3498|nr:hypothetical protein [Lysobacter silvestris]